MKRGELHTIQAEVDEILHFHGLEWVRDEVDEHMADVWPSSSPESSARDVDRWSAARLVLTLDGLHRAARLLLATELAVERAQARHTAGVSWLVVGRDDERQLLSGPPQGMHAGDRVSAVRGLGVAVSGLAEEVAAAFSLPYESKDLSERAEQESGLAREQDDEATAWSSYVELRELPQSAKSDGVSEF